MVIARELLHEKFFLTFDCLLCIIIVSFIMLKPMTQRSSFFHDECTRYSTREPPVAVMAVIRVGMNGLLRAERTR